MNAKETIDFLHQNIKLKKEAHINKIHELVTSAINNYEWLIKKGEHDKSDTFKNYLNQYLFSHGYDECTISNLNKN